MMSGSSSTNASIQLLPDQQVLAMCLLAITPGSIRDTNAWVFGQLIRIVHNTLLPSQINLFHPENIQTPAALLSRHDNVVRLEPGILISL